MKTIRVFLVLASSFLLLNCTSYHRDYGYRGRDHHHDRRYSRHDNRHRDYARDRYHDRDRDYNRRY